jgi:DNA-binding MarR family transcriptional regulator
MLSDSLAVMNPADEREQRDFQAAVDGLAAAMRRGRSQSARDAGAQMTAAQVDVLSPLAEASPDGLAVSQLANQAGVAIPTVTRMLHTLHERGYIERRRAPSDERLVMVVLTERGRAVLALHLKQLRARQREAYESFPPEERAVFIRGARRLTQFIRDNT